MKDKTYFAHAIDDLSEIGREIVPIIQQYPIVAFYGSMGVGKTTFIKVLCQEMAVEDIVSSPSFAIINQYLTKGGQPIFHFDFYRLRNEEELFDLGFEDYFYSGDICFLEWPEKIENYLPDERLNIFLNEMADGSREIRVSHPD